MHAPACVTVKIWPAMFNVPLRGLVLGLAVAYQVAFPLPVPLDGENVNQLGALLCGAHEQVELTVTAKVPLPAEEPGYAAETESE